jgi:hypothetical protein
MEIPASLGCHIIHTFESSKGVEIAVFARLGFVNPAWVTEGCGILLVAEIQWD